MAKKDTERRMRKLGEREEQVVVLLSDEEVEAQRRVVLDLMCDKDRLADGLKAIRAEYKARVDRLTAKIQDSRQQVSDRKRTDDVVVEEWLTAGNEVVRVRKDTGETVGQPRTARADELQEDLGLDEKTSGFPSSEEAFGGH